MRSVLIYSGGLDSTVLLYSLLEQQHEVKTLCIDYGQRHRKEIEYAQAIAHKLGVSFTIADLRAIQSLLNNSSLTSVTQPVPEGHYTESSMKSTVVPNRNMLMLALATAHAIAERYDQVAYAAHAGDHTIYPDCRPEFATAMETAIGLADWHKVGLYRPFINLTKADLVTLGERLGVPFAQTWSCYQGNTVHCGRCGTCVERREAFHLANVADPTEYANNAFPIDFMLNRTKTSAELKKIQP